MFSFKNLFFILATVLFAFTEIRAQQLPGGSAFKEVVLRTDTVSFRLSQDMIWFNNENQLPFLYTTEDQIAEVRIYPDFPAATHTLSLARSADFGLIDSLVNINNEYYQVKVRFRNLTASQFLNFTFTITDSARNQRAEVIRLFPFTLTSAKLLQEDNELFVGEEKVFELTTNNAANIKRHTDWVKGDGIDYRVSEQNGILRLHVMPTALGTRTLRVKLQTNKPSLSNHKLPTYDVPPIEKTFMVKGTRLRFLALDKKEIIYDEVSRTRGVEVLLDNSYGIALQKTYRIENQEQPGGVLIGELFTRQTVASNKVLCWLRVFNYHRISEGYLYLKDGDQARFITNFSIVPNTAIRSVTIMHEGGDWTPNLTVNPGETINLKIEGEGLHKARFRFDDLTDITPDSSLRSEHMAVYKLQVPVNISRRKIQIYNRLAATGYALTVKEFERPRKFDFVYINYGEKPQKVSGLVDGTISYEHVIKDIIFTFSPNTIENDKKLYGRQYLDIEVRITNSRNELTDHRIIENIVICPGDNSPRAAFYNNQECTTGEINLNNYLGRKTYDLNEWSRIEIIIRHDKDRYGAEGHSKKIDILLRRRVKFDTEVSFPAGLLVKHQGEEGYGNLGGISMAMIAQFSFYHPEKINRYRPYKIGAGFLALNAFNFSSSPSVHRDLGAVVIGSVYPTTRDTKLSFPLFVGGGYFLTKKSAPWFYFLGPGIQVRF